MVLPMSTLLHVASVSSRRRRGTIRRRGNSFEVRVYAGVDPLTGRDVYLSESTRDEREAERIRTRLLAKVDKQRQASTKATLGYALDAWLDVHEGGPRTIEGYRGYIENVIKPALGDVTLSKLATRNLEQFYAQLRRCRARCGGKPIIEHATDEPHECGEVRHRRKGPHDCTAVKCRVLDCGPHECRPMAASTIRQLHFIISGALSAAVRWDWIPTNPAATAKKPRMPAPQPSPPTPIEAGRIVAAAWEQDDDWGMFIWLAMVTGARRGELVALRWFDVHLDAGVLEIRRAYTQRSGKATEARTKTHQMRRLALDDTTVELLGEHRRRYEEQMAQLGREPTDQAFVFSYEPDHSRPCNPDGISHRYTSMCQKLGIHTHLHALRHYTATELIAGGADLRAVAGRLGHAGGGTTTLKVYAAWVAESDKRSADILTKNLHPPRR